MEKNKKKLFIIIGIVAIILVAVIVSVLYFNNTNEDNILKDEIQESEVIKTMSDYINESIIVNENTIIKDDYQNKIIIPKGFKLSKESGTNLVEGIVIEDETGNQYVWIPVGENLLKDNQEVSIQLGRYIFNDDGTIKLFTTKADEKIKEKESNILSFYELSKTEDSTNTQAKDIEEFLNSVNNNGGYYIARYEASKNTTTGKANSQKNATVWNNITQPSASNASQNIYDDSYGVTSDLVNSFAWDTAIIYIQNFSNQLNGSTYSKEGKFSGLSSFDKTSKLVKTGANKDEQCKINDLSGNVNEWSTETTNMKLAGEICECVPRGGAYYRGYKMSTAWRDYQRAVDSYPYTGFRTILYIK